MNRPAPDYLIFGHITQDLVEDGTRLGGTAFFSSILARRLGLDVALVTSYDADLDLEALDGILDSFKSVLFYFSTEVPEIPEELKQSFDDLAKLSCAAVESLVLAARAFFRDVQTVSDHLFKVHHYEKEADIVSDQLKRHIFSMAELDLAQKIHLRYFALNVEKISDMAEDVADRLAIYAIKQQM